MEAISQNATNKGSILGANTELPNIERCAVAMDTRTTSENIRIWHNTLEHPGMNMMNSLSKLGKILKFSKMNIASVVSHCDACNMAKARAGPIPDKSTNKATKMMERIHCDAVTRLPPTMGGKTGFSLIVDEHLKFIDV